jgi:uncharacterized protein (DUF1800 family)
MFRPRTGPIQTGVSRQAPLTRRVLLGSGLLAILAAGAQAAPADAAARAAARARRQAQRAELRRQRQALKARRRAQRAAARAARSAATASPAPAPAPAAVPSPAARQAALLGGPDRRPVVTLSPEVRHVIARLSFGATPALVEEVEALGAEAFVEQQLAPERIDDSALDPVLSAFPSFGLTNAQIRARYDGANDQVLELCHATRLRALWSRRQLFEVMVDFWANHFCIDADQVSKSWNYITTWDRDVLRRHAMGRFEDLLLASVQHPAMLAFLDNTSNRGDNPNENHARELLELHTVGVDGGYTEDDVRAAAYVLSGWTIGANDEFEFRSAWHRKGPLRVLDWSTAGTGGMADGISLLRHLAHHPRTARFVCRKLCRRFVSDAPPEALVESAAQVFLAEDTAVVPVLRHILSSQAFRDSAGMKLRRPFDFAIAVMRLVGARPDPAIHSDSDRELEYRFRLLGQPLFGHPDPDGYPDVADAWLSPEAFLQRLLFVNLLLVGSLGMRVDYLGLLPDPRLGTVGDLVSAAAARLLPEPLGAARWRALVEYLGVPASAPVEQWLLDRRGLVLFSMLLTSPEGMLR